MAMLRKRPRETKCIYGASACPRERCGLSCLLIAWSTWHEIGWAESHVKGTTRVQCRQQYKIRLVMGAQELLPRRQRGLMRLKAVKIHAYLTQQDQWQSRGSFGAHGELLISTHLSLRQVFSLIWTKIWNIYMRTDSGWLKPACWIVSTELHERYTLNWEMSHGQERNTAFA